MNLVEAERAKYSELWKDIPEYRVYSPGVENVQRFMDVIQPKAGASIVDVGCGTGVAGLMFAQHGLVPSWIDITDAGLHDQVDRERFIETPLWARWQGNFDYGFCCDVMEHIPPEYAMLVIDRIVASCRVTWFQISLVPDQFGAVIGQQLHLTVQPFKWWLDRLRLAGDVVDARDLCGQALYVVVQK